MKIDILTLFPDMFSCFFKESIIANALKKELITINVINIRDFSDLNHHQVDDTPYGGGAGMVLMCDPVFKAIESVKTSDSFVIMMSPQGNTFNQQTAIKLATKPHLIILCGHYEGFDERIKTIIDLELSVGDFIVTGGEVPAMLIVDAISRLVPGVINKESLTDETFNNNLFDYPTYTKPQIYRGMEVPKVLLSGNHQAIDDYRKEMQIANTKNKRPDLLE